MAIQQRRAIQKLLLLLFVVFCTLVTRESNGKFYLHGVHTQVVWDVCFLVVRGYMYVLSTLQGIIE